MSPITWIILTVATVAVTLIGAKLSRTRQDRWTYKIGNPVFTVGVGVTAALVIIGILMLFKS